MEVDKTMNDNEKMNNSTLRDALVKLNKATNQNYAVNSFDLGDSDKTQYGLVKANKDGTMDFVLKPQFTKREIYYHIQGYLKIDKLSVSTAITTSPTKKKAKKKTTKK